MKLDLGKQLGPLPLGAWVAVVGGGLGIAWYTRQNGPNDPIDEEVVDTGGDPGVGDGSVGGWIPTTPGGGAGSGGGGPVAPDTPPATNEEWAQKVINGLIAMGYAPTLVDSAVRKYIAASGDLSVSEWTVMQIALARYGAPPVALPPTGQNPPTNSPGPVKPLPVVKPKPPTIPTPSYTRYTVRQGDNLFIIAAKLYKNPLRWYAVYQGNRKGITRLDGTAGVLPSPNTAGNPGTVLIIPRSLYLINKTEGIRSTPRLV